MAKHEKEKLPPFDESAQFLANQGYAIEAHARQLFPGGQTITSKFTDAVRDTARLMRAQPEGPPLTIYQAAVLTNRRLFAQSDILIGSGDTWDIYEVKSGTKAKAEYIADLAFQKVAWEESGITIGRVFIIHVNSKYTREGEVVARELLVVKEVTSEVEAILARTISGILKALDIVASPKCPPAGPLDGNDYYRWMEVYRGLNPEAISSRSIFNLTRMNLALARKLNGMGIHDITDIPPSFELKPQQHTQILSTRAGRPTLHPAKIARELRKLKYPLYFLDYETVGPGIPLYNGTRPYQAVPFQYSLHILTAKGELSQREFLARGTADPVPDLVQQLREDIGPEGSVVVWNKSFEMKVNDTMGDRFTEHKAFLKSVNRRVYDLMEVFMKGLYADPGFLGSASIKRVLPVLVPEMSYKTLGIQEGQTASRKWQQIAVGEITGDDAEQAYHNLLEYCGQDTLAMVRIYEFLCQIVGEQREAKEQLELL